MIGAVAVGILAGCASEPDKYDVDEITVESDPAYVYCVEQGHKLERVTENGKRVPYCVLSEEERYTVWDFYEKRNQQEN
ncbi:hemolysin [Vibrio maritimus]|uniref:Hemolysin n=1 Tax=Vibrio maritimus TaxID=990268 RepID=A0A090SX75_9VIBR|nr:hemolysin [Vibrio maritimus]